LLRDLTVCDLFLQKWTGESDGEAVLSFTSQLLECCSTVYAKDPLMISASVLAISALIHQLKGA